MTIKQKSERQEMRAGAWSVAFLVLASLFFVAPAFAQLDTGLAPLAATGLATTDIRIIIANIIRVFLGLLGVIAIVLILYGGYLWMTSAGNEEKVEKAKKLLTNAAIGIAIILSAYSITVFIMSRFLSGTGVGGSGGADDGSGGGGRSGALGGGIIDHHYPGRNAKDIPRKTKILITFKEPMDAATVITSGKNNPDNVKLRKTIANPPKATDFISMAAVAVPTSDGTTKEFVFTPSIILGSPSEPISYTMRFEKGLKKANGQDAFGQFGTSYEWQFEVSTTMDSIPPFVESVIPVPQTEPYARNAVIQVNFSEPIDPTIVAGDQSTSKVVVKDKNDARVDGTVTVSNEYRTITFLAALDCGVENSCGGKMFCLPGDNAITVRLPSAVLKDPTQIGTADFTTAAIPLGITDLSGNALDGNNRKDANGKPVADGPAGASGSPFLFTGASYSYGGPTDVSATIPKDDFAWTFSTDATIDSTPPVVERMTPGSKGTNVLLDEPIRVLFSKPILSPSFNTATVPLTSLVNAVPTSTLNYETRIETIPKGESKTITTLCGRTMSPAETIAGGTKGKSLGIICHEPFAKNTAYTPTITAGVQDGYQNCYFPCAGTSCKAPTWQGFPSCKLP